MDQIADEVQEVAWTEDVAVLARGEHLCMTMRGIRSPATMMSTVMRGMFFEVPSTRAEFMSIVSHGEGRSM